MSDGHLNKCKDCTKSDVKERFLVNSERPEWLERERERGREKYYRLGYREKYKPTNMEDLTKNDGYGYGDGDGDGDGYGSGDGSGYGSGYGDGYGYGYGYGDG